MESSQKSAGLPAFLTKANLEMTYIEIFFLLSAEIVEIIEKRYLSMLVIIKCFSLILRKELHYNFTQIVNIHSKSLFLSNILSVKDEVNGTQPNIHPICCFK